MLLFSVTEYSSKIIRFSLFCLMPYTLIFLLVPHYLIIYLFSTTWLQKAVDTINTTLFLFWGKFDSWNFSHSFIFNFLMSLIHFFSYLFLSGYLQKSFCLYFCNPSKFLKEIPEYTFPFSNFSLIIMSL